MSFGFFFFFFKQKTAYEMRISDWSSDVCSSDLDFYRVWLRKKSMHPLIRIVVLGQQVTPAGRVLMRVGILGTGIVGRSVGAKQIGRASCRERVCQYV